MKTQGILFQKRGIISLHKHLTADDGKMNNKLVMWAFGPIRALNRIVPMEIKGY